MEGEMKRAEIMKKLGLTHRENFIKNYLEPALNKDYVEQTHPENPNHPKQGYRLTQEGEKLKQSF